MRWFYRAIGGGAWPVMRSHVSWCTKAMRVSLLRQKQNYYMVWDDGEPKCEIMVASSVWEGAALWFDVSLLITNTGPVRVGCVPLLFCTVIACLTRRPGCTWDDPHILCQNKQHPDQCISLFRATDGHLTCSYMCLSLPHRHKVWCGKLIKKRQTCLVTQGRNGAKRVYLGEKTILSL